MKNKYKTFLILFVIGAGIFALSFALSSSAKWWLKVIGVLIILASLAVIIIRDKAPSPVNDEYKYKAKERFMSVPEQTLYETLLRIAGGGVDVFAQVALASIVDKVTYASYRNELFRVVDFLLCSAKTSEPLLVIELNDASHQREERIRRDEKVKCILQRAGVPLLTLTLDEISDEKTLKRRIKSLL